MIIETRTVSSPQDLESCLKIRYEVFVVGQSVPLEEEVDGLDEESLQYLTWCEKIPAATARVRFINDYAKIERVAVLNSFQGIGLGKQIMNAVLGDLEAKKSVTKAKLSSQVHAIPFYEKLGFQVCSEEYLDANIPHRDMILKFKPII